MHPKRLLAALAVALVASLAWATDGTHSTPDELRTVLDEGRFLTEELEAIHGSMRDLVDELRRQRTTEPEPVPEATDEEEPKLTQTVSLGGSLDAQGCAYPGGVDSTYTTHLGYEFKRGALSGRGNVADKPRGSDCTEQGTTIDIHITQVFDDMLPGPSFASVEIGHDEHGVTGFDRNDRLVFGAVKQTTAAAMIGYALEGVLPGVLRVKGGWNVANGEPRFAASYALGEHVKLAGDCNGTDGDDPYCTARACWTRGWGDGWGVEACYEHANGFEHLPDAFSGRADAPAANEANGLRFAVTRSL